MRTAPRDELVRSGEAAGGMPKSRELEALLAPLGTRQFLSRYWGRQALFIRGEPAKFGRLGLSSGALEALLREPAGGMGFRWRLVGADDKTQALPDDPRRFALRDADGTVCAMHVEERFPEVAALGAGIKAALNLPGPVVTTCYASPDGRGLGTHWDPQSSFILQLEGTKRWRFAQKPAVPWPPVVCVNAGVMPEMRDRYPWMQVEFPDEAEQAAFTEQLLEPGDVLYLPAGTWHRASAVGHSLALTLGLVPMTAADFVIDLLRGKLSDSVDWRSSVPPVPMDQSPPDRLPAGVKRFFEARLAELKAQVRTLRPEDLYEAWLHHAACLDLPRRPESTAASSSLVSPATRLSPARDFPVRYVSRPDEGLVCVYHANRRTELSEALLPLLPRMLKARTFTARTALGWLDAAYPWEALQPVLQGLVEAGVLRVVAAEQGSAAD